MELQKQGCKLRALRLLCGIPVENKIIIFFHNSEKNTKFATLLNETLLTPLNN